MSVLSYVQLVALVEQGVITNVQPEQINGSSIDITLGKKILWEDGAPDEPIVLRDRTPLTMLPYDMDERGFGLRPHQFILAESEQVFHLPPNIAAEYKLKSSMARIGLEHMNAGWCDPGWNGSVLTMEFKNVSEFHTIQLHTGDRIGQVVFYEVLSVPPDKSYSVRGRYNQCATVSGPKPDPSL